MRANAFHQAIIDNALPGAEGARAKSSLPSAGFRVYRACNPHRAIGMFTTHQAEPSWT
ncbi:hypothetical protein [Halomonas sp. C05BenzN]|uniref:hypothetical protein n=1 Tax=Halomonas sp. C05BenzN TaxID=3411041 RepID=UPI003B92EDE2